MASLAHRDPGAGPPAKDRSHDATNLPPTLKDLSPLDAVRAVRALAAPFRFRVVPDPEGWPVIPGQLGQIESHDGHELAVYSDHPRLFEKLWAIPGVRRHQTGDQEMRALFPPEALEQVAGVIRARRRARRPMTPERLAVLAAGRQKARGAFMSATSRRQELVLAGPTGVG